MNYCSSSSMVLNTFYNSTFCNFTSSIYKSVISELLIPLLAQASCMPMLVSVWIETFGSWGTRMLRGYSLTFDAFWPFVIPLLLPFLGLS